MELSIEAFDLVEKVLPVIRYNLAHTGNAGSKEDLDILLVCLMRLTSLTVALSLKLEGLCETPGIQSTQRSCTEHLLEVWKQMLRFSDSKQLLNESTRLLGDIIEYDTRGSHSAFLLTQIRHVIAHRENYSLYALHYAVARLPVLVTRCPVLACKLGLDSSLLLLLHTYMEHQAATPQADSFPGIEIKSQCLQEKNEAGELQALVGAAVQVTTNSINSYIFNNNWINNK